ncbi:MAG: Lrp/AsnC family transcriptional regulator [Nodosilinea sp.]|jgi:Lrp/AsnC family transcriptional regulator for asnA, asnC and gidA
METLDQSPSSGLDDLDRKIIELMKVNGRITYKEVSDRVNIPEATARYRVQRLLNGNLLQVEAWINPTHLGSPRASIMNVSVENNRVNQVAEELAKLDAVQFLSIVSGCHNIVVNVYFNSQQDLVEFCDKLTAMRGVISYETQIVTRLIKARYDYSLN